MRLPRSLGALALAALLFFMAQALPSRAYAPNGIIAVPGGLVSMDIFWADATLGRAYLADRTNNAIDVFNTHTNSFAGRIPVPPPGSPNGVATDSGRRLVIYGAAASTTYVASATTLQNLGSLNTGGTGRADELGVDPVDQLYLIANDQDKPPFLTEISYANPAAPAVVGKVVLPQATDGIEQTVWVPETHQFMVAIPSINGGNGAIAVISTAPALVKLIPLDCHPAGMAHGPDSLMFVGCTPAPEVVNFLTGEKVATLDSQPSSDEIWYDPGANAYEFLVGAPTNELRIYSAATNTLFESDPVGGAFHNLTADAVTGQIFVALRPPNSNCAAGCVSVFSPPQGQPLPLAPSALGVNCGGIFFPNASFCTLAGTPAVTVGTTVTPATVTAPASTGVVCGGVFFPNAVFCGTTAPR